VLRECADSAIGNIVRWLWHDCAALDLMTLADFVGMQVEKSSCEDPIVGLLVDLVEQVNVTPDQKRYAAHRFEAAGANPAVVGRLKLAWRAALVAPERSEIRSEPVPSAHREAPVPEPRVDESLAMLGSGDAQVIELARAMLDEMFEQRPPSAALVYWLTVTVDELPAECRKGEIEWVLRRLIIASRSAFSSLPGIPPLVLQRWLETPQLLSANSTLIALELLSAQQPALVVRHYIHRAIALSDVRNAEITVGNLWRAIAKADAGTVLMIVSRWLAFGFDQCEFIELLMGLLLAESRANQYLLANLERGLAQTEKTPAVIIQVARTCLQQLRDECQKGGRS